MFRTLVRAFRASSTLHLDTRTNPYKKKRPWPPDYSKLSLKHQFQLEKRYKRRATLKWDRPVWKKWTKIVQWYLIGFCVIYSFLFLPYGRTREETLFKLLKDKYWDKIDEKKAEAAIVESKDAES